MAYLAMFHWVYLLGAALIGLLTGWVSVVHRGAYLSTRAMSWIMIGFVGFAVLSVMQLVPGRAGYWLDLALIMFTLFLAGGALGSVLRHAVISRNRSPAQL